MYGWDITYFSFKTSQKSIFYLRQLVLWLERRYTLIIQFKTEMTSIFVLKVHQSSWKYVMYVKLNFRRGLFSSIFLFAAIECHKTSHFTEQSWYYIQNTHSHLHCLLQPTITYSRTISGIMGSRSWVVGPPSPHWYQCSSWSNGDFHSQVWEVQTGFCDESWAILLLGSFLISDLDHSSPQIL